MAEETPKFVVTIDFEKNSPNPARIFRAAEKIIDAFEYIDSELLKSLQVHADNHLLLSDVKEGSLRIILRNALTKIDDNDLKKLDAKSIIGTFLVEAKKHLLRKLEDEQGIRGPEDVRKLSSEIQSLATHTDVKYLPDYQPPSVLGLVNGMRLIGAARRELSAADRLFVDEGKERIELKAVTSIEEVPFQELLSENKTIQSDIPTTLIIKKPDYIGNSKWEFRSDRGIIHARIIDTQWLERFHRKEVRLHPGDAIECFLQVEVFLGEDNRPLNTVYTVTRVLRVKEGDWRQVAMSFIP